MHLYNTYIVYTLESNNSYNLQEPPLIENISHYRSLIFLPWSLYIIIIHVIPVVPVLTRYDLQSPIKTFSKVVASHFTSTKEINFCKKGEFL